MVTCTGCDTIDPITVEDQNIRWCTNSGQQLAECVQYVHSYSNPCHFRRKQFYCRVQRFSSFLFETCKHQPYILQKSDEIRDVYSNLEFLWCNRESSRTYFFAKAVMLQYCCRMLKIETEYEDFKMPCLKDKNREIIQFAELERLQAYGRQTKLLTCIK